MKQLLSIIILILSFSLNAFAAQEAPMPLGTCKVQAPYGFPQDNKDNAPLVCRHAYVLQHDSVAKIPVWVSYTLTPEHTDGCVKRTNGFKEDRSLVKGQRAELYDYRNSGYDKGHIANDADMTWSAVTESESLILSNMTPQLHGLNAGIWKDLEEAVRAWAFSRKHTMLVYAGPIYVGTTQFIGKDKVAVPLSFYKIVVDTETKEVLAFIFPHENVGTNDLSLFETTVANVENITGVTFNVPASKATKDPVWPIDLKSVAKAKKELCSK